MAINLSKGSSINLSKESKGLSNIIVGLGWDVAENKPEKKGLFSGMFSKPAVSSSNFDLDASAILCTNGHLTSSEDVVYYSNLNHESNAVNHMGDNLTGDGDGDDEQILVDLKNLPDKYDKIGFVVNIYSARSRNQHFGMIKNAFIRIVDANTNSELCRFNLTDDYSGTTAMIFGDLYKQNGEWQFKAIGEGTNDGDINGLTNRYR